MSDRSRAMSERTCVTSDFVAVNSLLNKLSRSLRDGWEGEAGPGSFSL